MFQKLTNKKIMFALLLLILMTAPFVHAVVLESGIPGQLPPGTTTPNSIALYINYLYLFVLGVVGIAVFASLVFWGVVWISSGIADRRGEALGKIKDAFTGLAIALGAYIILNTINPDLLTLKDLSENKVKIAVTESNRCGQLRNSIDCKMANCYWYGSMCSNIRPEDQRTYVQPKTTNVADCNFSTGVMSCGRSYQKKITGGKWQCESFLSFMETNGQAFSIVASDVADTCGRSTPSCSGYGGRVWCVAKF